MQQPPHCNRKVHTLTTCRHQQSHFKCSSLSAASVLGSQHKFGCDRRWHRQRPSELAYHCGCENDQDDPPHSSEVHFCFGFDQPSELAGVLRPRARCVSRGEGEDFDLSRRLQRSSCSRNVKHGCTQTRNAQGCATQVIDSADSSPSSVHSAQRTTGCM